MTADYTPTTDEIIRYYCYCPDCFIDQFPDDMEQAGALHPEFFIVLSNTTALHPSGKWAQLKPTWREAFDYADRMARRQP